MRVRIWCEDREHEGFMRRLFLEEFRVNPRSIDISIAPNGKGAASKWVIDQYEAIRLQARISKHQSQLGFVLMVDGDNVGVDGRMKGLHPSSARDREERVAILIPTWEIETWVLWLANSEVDESRSFKDRLDPRQFRELLPQAVGVWKTPRQDETSRLPSLSRARHELARLPR